MLLQVRLSNGYILVLNEKKFSYYWFKRDTNVKTVATIEARMTSSRLPGKMLLKASGSSMFEHLCFRLKTVSLIDEIVLATTTNPADDDLVKSAQKMGVNVFRGDEFDVMSRVIGAARSTDADVIVQITGDCPIIDPGIVAQTIQVFNHNNADYVGNALIRSYPDGMDVQVFSLETLELSARMTTSYDDREHVSLHIRNNPNIFSHINLIAPPEIFWPELGLTLDERADYKLIKILIEHFSQCGNSVFSCFDAVQYLKENPELLSINNNVARKGAS
jgi:spore coat polysaccharide biosynthesis protein SpsF